MRGGARAEKTRPLEPGARIGGGKLELIRHLGEGGMGAVWIARNVATEADVAIKVLSGTTEEDEALAAARFRNEAKLGAMLAHRNITRVFDLIEDDDGALILVMELLRGETLGTYYRSKGALTNEEAVALIVPILSALQHAHEHGIIHRDLKPSNIFVHVDPDGHVTPKLLDFGIAKVPDASLHTRAGEALGTPSYMSPEQVRASKQLDGRSDLFSVGVVLYEIITGLNPFRASLSSATLAQVLEVEVDPDPRIEPRVWLEVQRALAKQAYERHACAKDLATALCAAVGQTEAALAASIRQAPPRLSEAPKRVTSAEPSPSARSQGGAPVSTRRSAKPRDGISGAPASRGTRRRSRAALAGGAFALLFVGAGLLLRSVLISPAPAPIPGPAAKALAPIPGPATGASGGPASSASTDLGDLGDLGDPAAPGSSEPRVGSTRPSGASGPRRPPKHPATPPASAVATPSGVGRSPGF